MKYLVIVFMCLATIHSMAQTEIVNKANGRKAIMYVDKNYRPHAYKNVVLVSGFNSPDKEKKIIAELKEYGIEVQSSLGFLPPFKEYTQAEVLDSCKARNIDAVITLKSERKQRITSNITEATLTLTDVTLQPTPITTFVGDMEVYNGAAIASPDKGVLKFIQLIRKDLAAQMGIVVVKN